MLHRTLFMFEVHLALFTDTHIQEIGSKSVASKLRIVTKTSYFELVIKPIKFEQVLPDECF